MELPASEWKIWAKLERASNGLLKLYGQEELDD